ncbi:MULTISPECIES: LPS export ABC transporter periplasmic protein LptC [Prochlorococcus]|uniref:Uncharacterized conserved protein with a signal peptide n=1 Tax=Prochlorococcus marinus (strain SARG / CCMP1375 / SS120) TaxID=167539 RepID=Q7VBX1_PROMA|nr:MULTISPECIES: LPS export ABC transporter periplasmic protein LptC [Prochlorococcus]AAQ00016.1 Uncharacterized conserved protein with a signal peptide [Prochlorococcus marinus subsp. marinus str. CCMP1375]KGG13811.1 putative SMC domain N terminal domain [Prochlorococcus marinus str. LG]KGG18946.1 putative SMC domain N terminal domain [Prochlorococcus marinus str. SS2]KGG23516.1 putative SMC domain N terminal domain [Prochlorococcus marinus str. SS35]KGG32248.1 putative SMC domain N terminal 
MYSIIFKLFIALGLVGCSSEQSKVKQPSFKFTNINLEQLDNNGNKQFSFTTKKAEIVEISKSLTAKEPVLIFYQGNKPYYKIQSNKASLINNGQLITLKNKVTMQSINNTNLNLLTDLIKWDKDNSRAELSGSIISRINGSMFRSSKAVYDHTNNTIEFIGIKKFTFSDKSLSKTIKVKADKAIWYANQNRLYFSSNDSQVRTSIDFSDILKNL